MWGARVKPPSESPRSEIDVEDAAGDGDEEDADDGEADRQQSQAEDDEPLCLLSPHVGAHSNWLGSQTAQT